MEMIVVILMIIFAIPFVGMIIYLLGWYIHTMIYTPIKEIILWIYHKINDNEDDFNDWLYKDDFWSDKRLA